MTRSGDVAHFWGGVSRDAVARWNRAYAEQTSAMFAVTDDANAVRRRARAYREVAVTWRTLAGESTVPFWARHAAEVAATEFERRAATEFDRLRPSLDSHTRERGARDD